MTIDAYEAMDAAFKSGDIQKYDNEVLQKHLLLLCSHNERNETIRHRDIIRGLTINHILLQRHIEHLDQKGTQLQWLVFVVAVASLVSSLYPIFKNEPNQGNVSITTPTEEPYKSTPELKTNPAPSNPSATK